MAVRLVIEGNAVYEIEENEDGKEADVQPFEERRREKRGRNICRCGERGQSHKSLPMK